MGRCKVDRELCFQLAQHTCLLYVRNPDKQGRIEGVGTGIYVEYEDKKYILTTGHTFHDNDVSDVHIHMSELSLSTDCYGVVYLPSRESVRREVDFGELDYAIFQLKDSAVDKLDEFFVPYPIVRTRYELTTFQSFIFGFAASRNVQWDVRKGFRAWWAAMYLPRIMEGIEGCSWREKVNFAFKYTIRKIVLTHDLAKPKYSRGVQPNGMSGCGVWAIPHYPYDLSTYGLQGMLTGYYKEKNALVGFKLTDIWELLALVADTIETEILSGKREENILFSLAIVEAENIEKSG